MAEVSVFFNHDAERAILAAMLKKNLAQDIALRLRPEDFHEPQHRKLFELMQGQVMARKPLDFPLLADAANRRYGDTVLIDEVLLPAQCDFGFGTEFSADANIALLKKTADARGLYTAVDEARSQLRQGEQEPAEIIEALREKLRPRASDGAASVGMQTMLLNAYAGIERRAKGEDKGLPSGIKGLDRITAGFHRGELTIVGARPSVGKSAFAMQAAITAAEAGAKVCVCSREMTAEQYGERILMRGTSIKSERLRSGDLAEDDWGQLTDSMCLYGELSIEALFDTKYIEELRAWVRTAQEKDGIDLLIVDYLQLMQTRRRFEKDYLRIGYISKELKDISTEFNIAVIALAQVGRASEGDMPTLSDLRGSGDMEQDADNVVFLHRPLDAGDKFVRRGDTDVFEALKQNGGRYLAINVAKQRQGEIGTVITAFYPGSMRFEQLPRREAVA